MNPERRPPRLPGDSGGARDDPPDDAVLLTRVPDARRAQELALVLRALGIPHLLHPEERSHALFVAARDAGRAGEELRRYLAENPPAEEAPAASPAPRAPGLFGVLLFILLLTVMDRLSALGAFDLDWFAAGRTHAARIREGEIFRAFTALTLHTGGLHLTSNLVFGALFGFFLFQLLGNGCGLAAVFLAGGLGNLVNAWVQAPGHLSVGASTAVFGALGLLVAQSLPRRRRESHWLRRYAPLIAGAILLGYLGTEGERTDVFAHLFGFLVGALLGLPLARWTAAGPPPARVQWLCGLAALALLTAAWTLAFSLLPAAA